MLDVEYKYFTDNHEILYKMYPNKFVLIVGDNVLGAFDSFSDAIKKAISDKLRPGEFFIDQCKGEITPQVFHSRVRFC